MTKPRLSKLRPALAGFAVAMAALPILGVALMQSENEPKRATLDGLAWMAGSWSNGAGEGESREDWMAPAGGLMLGMNRQLAGGRAVFFEFLRIEERADGVFYVAQPKGGRPTAFKMTSSGEAAAVFELPEHDFPQRIEYARDGATLTARVSGSMDGKPAEQRFSWTLRE